MQYFVFEIDERKPPDNYRRARFLDGWQNAVSGDNYEEQTLRTLTWENLGFRLGKLFGKTAPNFIDEMYEWCVRQYGGREV